MEKKKTRIRASHIVAFDGQEHRYLKDGEVVFEGDTIVYVGKAYTGEVDETIDAENKVVIPGLVCVHSHMAGSPMDRSFLEDCGNPRFYFSGLYDFLMVQRQAMDPEMARLCFEYSLVEQIRSGTTTVVEMGPCSPEDVELAAEYGNRVYFGPMYASAAWHTPDGKQVRYQWDEEAGERGLDSAIDFIHEYHGACDDRIRGLLSPLSADTCTESLLKRSQEAARDLAVPLTIHASQSVIEFNEMLARYGKTPLAWLSDIGFLRENVILGHAIIIGGSSWANYPEGDLSVLAESGCTVAHCPWVFARRGIVMESFHRYRQSGVRMGLGTDTCPQNMIHAMRWAAVLSKTVERNTLATPAAHVFNAATIDGARALGRDDLGRICKGAKADLVILSGDTMNMVPLRDPVRNIVYNAETEDVDTVIVNGSTVMEKGRLCTKDYGEELNRRLQAAGERLWSRIPDGDYEKRDIDVISPMAFKSWDGVPGH